MLAQGVYSFFSSAPRVGLGYGTVFYILYIVRGFEVYTYGVFSLESPCAYCCHCALVRSSCSRRKLSEKLHFEKLGGSVKSQDALEREGGANNTPSRVEARRCSIYQAQGGNRKNTFFSHATRCSLLNCRLPVYSYSSYFRCMTARTPY